MNIRRIASFIIMALAIPAVAQTGGGTSGADFLIAPPAARVDAMGGVADPLGTGLEAMNYYYSATLVDEVGEPSAATWRRRYRRDSPKASGGDSGRHAARSGKPGLDALGMSLLTAR